MLDYRMLISVSVLLIGMSPDPQRQPSLISVVPIIVLDSALESRLFLVLSEVRGV